MSYAVLKRSANWNVDMTSDGRTRARQKGARAAKTFGAPVLPSRSTPSTRAKQGRALAGLGMGEGFWDCFGIWSEKLKKSNPVGRYRSHGVIASVASLLSALPRESQQVALGNSTTMTM